MKADKRRAIMSEKSHKVVHLKLERDYKKFLYFIDGQGNVCRKAKGKDANPATEIIVPNAIVRDKDHIFFVDKDGDISKTPRASLHKKKAVVTEASTEAASA